LLSFQHFFITSNNCRTACLGWGGRPQFDFFPNFSKFPSSWKLVKLGVHPDLVMTYSSLFLHTFTHKSIGYLEENICDPGLLSKYFLDELYLYTCTICCISKLLYIFLIRKFLPELEEDAF